MSVTRGFRRLWVVVATLWIVVCVAAGSWLGYSGPYVEYCSRYGTCQRGYPPDYANYMEFERDRQIVERLGKASQSDPEPERSLGIREHARARWDRVMAETNVVNVPAKMDWRLLGGAVLAGVAGAVFLYAIGGVVGWVARGFQQG